MAPCSALRRPLRRMPVSSFLFFT